MTEPEQTPKRPHAVLRALLTFWLLSWFIIIAFFIRSQFDPQPLFGWVGATVWIGISVASWLFIFRLLNKLRQLPPE
ncbi:MAG: hypothetical protein GQ535_05915 [Rhodobacteraceae bacterium]|nr:hypothetical protein [Paracoccaceae bacterium]